MKKTKEDLNSPSPSPSQAMFMHLICGLGLASSFWAAHNVYSINLIADPSQTLTLIWVIEAPIVILVYSLFRQNPEKCSYLKAVGRGTLGLPAGAVLNMLGAIALGAPVHIQLEGNELLTSFYPLQRTLLVIPRYFQRTLNWSLLMSLFTFVPAASVFGSSWTDWQRLLALTKPIGSMDYMISLPAIGAIIGAWFGAWPMPLDWERPWQEWPICVSHGAIAGYLIGMVVSCGFVLWYGRQIRIKGD